MSCIRLCEEAIRLLTLFFFHMLIMCVRYGSRQYLIIVEGLFTLDVKNVNLLERSRSTQTSRILARPERSGKPLSKRRFCDFTNKCS